MAQHGFPINGGHSGSVDPSHLAMAGSYPTSFHNGFSGHNPSSNGYSGGSALFGDDELADGLGSPTDAHSGMMGQEFGGMGDLNVSYMQQGMFGSHQPHSLPVDQSRANGFSSTPDGDPIQSPYVHSFAQYGQMPFGRSVPYPGSPLANSAAHGEGDSFQHSRPRMSQAMQRKMSSTRSALNQKPAPMPGLSVNSDSGFGAQPIRTPGPHHDSANAGQYMRTPNSLTSLAGSGLPSPQMASMHSAQINEMMLKGSSSVPSKLETPNATAQELRKKKRRESHNQVERRRRDNINERIQDLSKLVPAHRLEDEKIRKAIQNGTPLSPTLPGISSPSQATSGLAGPGARRATGGAAGNITTGLPMDDKDKGPNKGDILNGSVSWTRDLMWMLHLKIQQQEELLNYIQELGGAVPFELTDDERRMQTELLETMCRNDNGTKATSFSYSRTAGSGLRVPHHTDFKGEPLNGSGSGSGSGSYLNGSSMRDGAGISITPEAESTAIGSDGMDANEYLDDFDDGSGELDFKEEDEFGMDLTA